MSKEYTHWLSYGAGMACDCKILKRRTGLMAILFGGVYIEGETYRGTFKRWVREKDLFEKL